MSKRIICIGDSNTYGYDPAAFGGARYPDGVRWTSRLGSAWDIQNLGENGREIPSSSFAVRVLLSQVRSRLPADGLCLMLGTNDLLCGVSFCDASGWDIPVVFDGVHFSEQGHRRFAEQLEPVFAQTFL